MSKQRGKNSDGMPAYGPDEDTFDDIDTDLSSADGIADDDSDDDAGKEEKRKHPRSGRKKAEEIGLYSMDDVGNAKWLLAEYGEDMRWDDSLKEWVIWTGVRWEVDSHEATRRAMSISEKILAKARAVRIQLDDKEAAKKLEIWGNQCGNLSRIRAMLDIAKSMKGVSVLGEHFNSNRRLLSCPNGTLELRRDGIKFRPTRREDLVTKVTGCEYDEDARSEMFNGFLDKFLPDIELREWTQKVAGYSLIGGNPKRKIVFCWGPTSSGKSTFAELLRAAMGSYAGPFNLSMLRENQDERPRPDLVQAINQRAIFASEASADWHLHADMIKRATGQDPLLARLPHSGAAITKIPDFTPWIITNNIPTINGADQALYRRLCTVLFPNTIEDDEENEDFRAELIERGELPGVLAWLVEGWRMFCEEGLSDPPHEVVKAEMSMREQFSDLDRFLADCCDKGSGAEYRSVPSELYSAYEDWADDNGVKNRERLSNTAFGRALNGRGFAMKHVKEEGKSVRRRLGIRLKVGK